MGLKLTSTVVAKIAVLAQMGKIALTTGIVNPRNAGETNASVVSMTLWTGRKPMWIVAVMTALSVQIS